jgi:predicted ribosomally synthesized peptide with nif11-like leader
MSKVTEFYEAFSTDEAMRKRADALKGSGGEGGKSKAEAIVAFANKEGYTFTEEELKDSINSKELPEEDLAQVFGGIADNLTSLLTVLSSMLKKHIDQKKL